MSGESSAGVRALEDDPVWVLDRYREARGLLDEIATLAPLPHGLSDEVGDFLTATAMSGCTTLGPDCRCNRSPQ